MKSHQDKLRSPAMPWESDGRIGSALVDGARDYGIARVRRRSRESTRFRGAQGTDRAALGPSLTVRHKRAA
ncbi:MAG: hypothetical protein ACYDA0_11540 [Candidatus Dormibacteraceae bacterium]